MAVVVLGVLGGACDTASTVGGSTGAGGSAAADDGATGSPIVAIAIDCSFVYAGTQTDVTYEPSDDRTVTAVGGSLLANGVLSDDEYEGRSFSLSMYAEDGSVSMYVLYQMDRSQLPHNEFYGDHGFTGLHVVREPGTNESVQFACFARRSDEPPHVWEE